MSGSQTSGSSLYEGFKDRLRDIYAYGSRQVSGAWHGAEADYEGARCILQAAYHAERYAPDAILNETGYELTSLLEGLLPGLLQMLAVVGATTVLGGAIGGIIGALAGGVGAAPGAAVGGELGFDVGMAALTWMGVAFLAVAIARGFGEMIDALHKGIFLAWNARKKHGVEEQLEVERAARDLARAVGILMRLILMGIVAYLLKKAAVKSTKGAIGTINAVKEAGAMEVSSATVADLVGKLRSSRLGQDGFADWVEKNWRKLVDDPKLRGKSVPAKSASTEGSAPSSTTSGKSSLSGSSDTPTTSAAATVSPVGQNVYRVDGRPPETIFDQGFQPKGTSTDLETYVNTNQPSNFVSTSKTPAIADNPAFGQPGKYLYEVDGQQISGIDVNQAYPANPFANEDEIAVPGGIPSSAIVGAKPILPNGQLGETVLNPNYISGHE